MTWLHLVIVSERLRASDFSLTICGSAILSPILPLDGGSRDLAELTELVLAGSSGLVEMVKGEEFFLRNSGSCSIFGLSLGVTRSSSSEC